MKIRDFLLNFTRLAAPIPAARPTAKHPDRIIGKLIPKTVSRVRRDISDWTKALRAADNTENPRRAQLIHLLDNIRTDALVTSQLELRFQQTLSAPFVIKRNDTVDETLSAMLASASWVDVLNREILLSIMYGHSLIEFSTDKEGELVAELIPRNHVVPEKGLILKQEFDSRGIDYRNAREYGWWWVEFGAPHDYGLLNKAVPHALYKRFAQSCWSELCEIYGIPPRVLKTNTTDQAMLSRADQMMRDLGSAAYWIIDQSEEFEFAKSVETNGDVYKNLIALCNNEISLLISGAVIGQDTVNGNRSKEEVGVQLLDKLVQADRHYLTVAWNDVIIPALVRIGVLPDSCVFELQQEEDIEKLWKMTAALLPHKEVDNEWIADKFGIPVATRTGLSPQLSAEGDGEGFFD